MLVILGTAHGSNIKGKRSPDERLLEYKWSREICYLIQGGLNEKGIPCVIDIEGEIEESLTKRKLIVNDICKKYNKNKCIYVSIHINAASQNTWSKASGWTVYVGDNCSENSKKLALSLFNTVDKYNKENNKNLFGNRKYPKTKYYESPLYILNQTSCPAILTENMYMTNKDEVDFLLSEEGKCLLCDLHVEGICNYIDSMKKK